MDRGYFLSSVLIGQGTPGASAFILNIPHVELNGCVFLSSVNVIRGELSHICQKSRP